MVDLTIKDSKASGGGCGCGCGGHEAEAASTPAVTADCNCGPECTCGCQDGKPCTCGDAEGTTATYTVTGMTCEHCVRAVTEEVLTLDGVTSVTVDLDSGRLEVHSDAPVDFDRIVEAVAEAGEYTVN